MIFCVEMSKYILLAREMNTFWSGSISSIRNNIVIRSGKMFWKHGSNGPFFAHMLRTKLY